MLPENGNPSLFELYSDRGFLTLTGTYKGVQVSIVSIGMGAPNMDFFVREGREVLDEAGEEEMVIIR
jgi:uridine phosphorylase